MRVLCLLALLLASCAHRPAAQPADDRLLEVYDVSDLLNLYSLQSRDFAEMINQSMRPLDEGQSVESHDGQTTVLIVKGSEAFQHRVAATLDVFRRLAQSVQPKK